MTDVPQLPVADEERLKAELALQKAFDLADTIAAQQQHLERNYRKLFGAMPGESRDRIIWRGIAAFANATLPADIVQLDAAPLDAKSDAVVEINKVLHLLIYCAQTDLADEDFLESFSDVCARAGQLPKGGPLTGSRRARFVFSDLCLRYQPRLKRFLTWLCEPQKHKDLTPEALTSLGHAQGVNVQPDLSDANFDESSSKYCPVYYWKTTHYQTLMSPICKFIFDRIERYHEWLDRDPRYPNEKLKDNEAMEREKAVPIFICERPGCGKFCLPQRTGRKKFCSKVCCDLTQPGRTPEENKDYMLVYRLEQLKLPVLRQKIKSKEQRLAKIQNDWPGLAERIQKLKDRAAGQGSVKRVIQ